MPSFASLLNAPQEIIFINDILLFITYIIQSYFFMVLADNLQIKDKWKAWIPVFNLYLMGEICEKEVEAVGYKNRLVSTFWMTLASAILLNFFNTGLLGIILAITTLGTMLCHTLFNIQGTYWIYKKYIPRYAILGIILSCLFMTGQIVFELIILTSFRKKSNP